MRACRGSHNWSSGQQTVPAPAHGGTSRERCHSLCRSQLCFAITMGQGSNGLVDEQAELAELKALLRRSTLFAETNPCIHVVPSTAK